MKINTNQFSEMTRSTSYDCSVELGPNGLMNHPVKLAPPLRFSCEYEKLNQMNWVEIKIEC
jgi:hypothetical protein